METSEERLISKRREVLVRRRAMDKEAMRRAAKIQDEIKTVLGDLLPKNYRDGKPLTLFRGKGCNECGNTGYSGRIAIFEVLKITPTINKMILQSQSAKDIETQARKEGLIIMKQDGYLKAIEGLTTIEEILRIADI
ncbi:MAG: hypothetical protein HYU00_05325 [Nitrosarchaeum sp.]|nr:hypothetical protein [Nitrosarchaeum sp.]